MPRDITKQQLRIVTAVCAFSLSMAQVKAEDQFLVDEGKAYAEIIISESSARSTRLAAAELQTYVAKISGSQLPIRVEPSVDVPVQIYVGESLHAAKFGVTADRLEHGSSGRAISVRCQGIFEYRCTRRPGDSLHPQKQQTRRHDRLHPQRSRGREARI